MTTDANVLYCPRHPSVETALRCGRCETLICPRCTVFTDVGARCQDCAPARKLPQFEVSPVYLLRGAAAAAVSGAMVGAAWGFFVLDLWGFLMIGAGLAMGWAISESIGLATNKKSGPALQAIAVGGMAVAYVAGCLVGGFDIVPSDGAWRLIAPAVGAIFAVSRLRY